MQGKNMTIKTAQCLTEINRKHHVTLMTLEVLHAISNPVHMKSEKVIVLSTKPKQTKKIGMSDWMDLRRKKVYALMPLEIMKILKHQ